MNLRASGIAIAGVVAAIVAVAMWSTGPPQDEPEYLEVLLDHPAPDRPAAKAGAPNVVMVIGCTVRQDQTSVYGGPPQVTPFLAERAATGVRFADPITAAPWTRAASTALVTGHHPLAVGMAHDGSGRNDRALPERLDTIAERFRQAGYATAGVTLNPNLNSVYGFRQGFDGYVEPAALWNERPVKLPSIYAVQALTELLDSVPSDRPLYLQVMLVDAHSPVSVHPPDLQLMPNDGTPDVVREYRAGLRQFDRGVRAIHRYLASRGVTDDNSLFVITNDHGEGLGYPMHHGKAHGRFLVPSAIGGVWLVNGVGVAPGHVVEGMASQVDIPNTTLALAGLAPLGGPGLDLSAQVRGEESTTGRLVAYSDTWFREVSRAAAYRADIACQVDYATDGADRGKTYATGCFDRQKDPSHTHPFDDAGMSFLVRHWRDQTIEAGRAFGAADEVAADPAIEAQLEALGYFDDEP